MEDKICIYCGKKYNRYNYITKYNSKSGTKKRVISNWNWKNIKYCSKICGTKGRHKESWKNPKIREARKRWREKNLTPEKKKQYYRNGELARKLKYYSNKEKYRVKTHEYNKKMKEGVFNKYNHRCAICGFSRTLDIHHLDNGTRSIKNIDNVMLLCPNHHAMFHRGIITNSDLFKFIK